MHPSLRRFRRDEGKAESAHAPLAGLSDGLNVGTRDPKRRMRFLIRLRDHVARREIIELSVIFPVGGGEHGNNRFNSFQPTLSLRAHLRPEGMQLRRAAAFTETEFDPPARQQIERRDTFRDTVWLVRCDLNDSVAKTDILGPLARRA